MRTAVACLAWCVATTVAVTRHPLLLVLSLDGFRVDYLRPDLTPNLIRFRDAAAAPPYMRPAFPTKTFVNHFSIATGLYAETHGVLDNVMFDGKNESIKGTYEQFHFDERVLPIWTHNEFSDYDRYSGIMMWPGAIYPYQEERPTYYQIYDTSISFNERIDKIMSWINNEERPANLIFAYFEEPDKTAHKTGIKSQDIKEQIINTDNAVKYLLDQITLNHLENKLNLIILSDHGMDSVTYENIIFLDKYISNTTYKIITTGPNAFILPNPGLFNQVHSNLVKTAKMLKSFIVYKQDQLPERWHIKNSPKLRELLYLVANSGHMFYRIALNKVLDVTPKDEVRLGTHGYDNDLPQMHAICMASGPLFKKNFTAKPFDNIDLNPLFRHILNLKEIPDTIEPNGTISGVEQLLSTSDASTINLRLTHAQCILTVLSLYAITG